MFRIYSSRLRIKWRIIIILFIVANLNSFGVNVVTDSTNLDSSKTNHQIDLIQHAKVNGKKNNEPGNPFICMNLQAEGTIIDAPTYKNGNYSIDKSSYNKEKRGKDNTDNDSIIFSVLPKKCEAVSRVLGPERLGQAGLSFPNKSIHDIGLVEADLQYMWDCGNNKVMVVFGDNYNTINGQRTEYRSNALCFSTDVNLQNGVSLDGVVWTGWKQIIDRTKDRQDALGSLPGLGVKQIIDRQGALGSIPTTGVTVGNVHYIHYMNVYKWDENGNWNDWATNFSEIAYSIDDGQNWILSGVKWGADSYFAQAAYFKENGMVYMFGTESGRLGQVRLARVDETKILDKSAYEYWNGASWGNQELDAAPLTSTSSGEVSVIYNSYFQKYFMVYVNNVQRIIAFRDADSLNGDWSGEKILMINSSNDVLYNACFYPWFNDSTDLYFFVNYSQPKSTYTVILMHAELVSDPTGFNILNDHSFENELVRNDYRGKSNWVIPDNVKIVASARTGSAACKLTNEDSSVYKYLVGQKIPVRKNSDYVLTGWIRGSYDGVKSKFLTKITALDNEGKIIIESPVNKQYHTINSYWTKFRHEFTSGDYSYVSITCGLRGLPGLAVIIDDFNVLPKQFYNRKE
jgi:hypothetical protein